MGIVGLADESVKSGMLRPCIAWARLDSTQQKRRHSISCNSSPVKVCFVVAIVILASHLIFARIASGRHDPAFRQFLANN